jgi:hypothetical protein
VARRTSEKLEDVGETARRNAAQKLEEGVTYSLAGLISRAETASNDLNRLLESFQSEIDRSGQVSSELRSELTKAQESVQLEMQRFRSAAHDALVQAKGHIKGQIDMAVSLAEQPLVTRTEQLKLQIEQLVTSGTQELTKRVETASERLEECHRAAETSIKDSWQSLLSETLESFRMDVQKLSNHSVTRWNQALTEMASALPQSPRDNVKKG